MLFLNPWVLLGLLGVAVPIILHLLNRRKSMRIDWGAMMFLMASLAERRRRVLVEEVLLMLARCLIVALAVFVFARPFASSGGVWGIVAVAAVASIAILGASAALWSNRQARRRMWIAGGALAAFAALCVIAEWGVRQAGRSRSGAKDVAVILDASASMTVKNGADRVFDAAKKAASDFIESSARNTAFTLILGGSVPQALTAGPTTDRRELFRLLDEAVPVQGTLNVPDALAVAAASLSQGYNGNKQILIVGDGQAAGWDIGEDETWKCVEDVFGEFPHKPKVVLRRIAQPESLRNLTVSSISLSRAMIGTDREVGIDVKVSNNGTEAASAQSVSLSVEGRVLTDSSLGQLQPGESRIVSFSHKFTKPGTHEVKAYLDLDDDMPADNSTSIIAPVKSSMDVLIVEGTRSRRMSDRPGAFLALALSPLKTTLDDDAGGAVSVARSGGSAAPSAPPALKFMMRPKIIDAKEFASVTNLTRFGAVILADVPRLGDDESSRLMAYVERGGGLLVINSSNCDPAFYNGWTDADGIPAMPLGLEGEEPVISGGAPLDPRTFSHPALSRLAEKGDLESALFESAWKSTVREDAGASAGARLFDGTSLFAERRAGRGRIVQFATGLDSKSGNVVSRQSFLPMVHELVQHVARPVAPNLNLPPSSSASIILSDGSVDSGDETRGGLRGIYRMGRDGDVIRMSIDRKIDFNWHMSSLDPLLPWDSQIFVEWSGSLEVPQTGTYEIYANSGGIVTIEFADDKRNFGLRRSRLSIDLAAGKRHDFVVTYAGRNRNGSYINLRWKGPVVGDQVIQEKYLSPVRVTDKAWDESYPAHVSAPEKDRFLEATLRKRADSLSLDIKGRLTPGVYSASVPAALAPELAGFGPLSNGWARISFSVSSDGAESRLAPLGDDDAAYVARFADFSVASDAAQMSRALDGAAIGRELWRYFAFPLLALVLLEVALCRWITDQRRTGEEGSVEFGEAKPKLRFGMLK